MSNDENIKTDEDQENYNNSGTQPAHHYCNVKQSNEIKQIIHPMLGSMLLDVETIRKNGWGEYVVKIEVD